MLLIGEPLTEGRWGSEPRHKGMIYMSAPISERNAAERKRSIRSAAVKQWHFLNFANTAAALNFINASPAQGAGEISTTARNDGTVGLFYFL